MNLLLLIAIVLLGALTAFSTSACGSPEPRRPARPRTSERLRERDRLAERMVERGIADRGVIEAIRAVPRHWFVPQPSQAEAYDDNALAIGSGQTISQPYIVALMTEALALTPASRVLEIGTGSGYQAAVLSEIAARVYTIEIVPELAERARELFASRGYTNIVCRLGDGSAGWPELAPFDAVIVTAAPEKLPRALFDQLAVGGRMCIPVGPDAHDQELLAIEKLADGSLKSAVIAPVRFVPMTGEAAQAD